MKSSCTQYSVYIQIHRFKNIELFKQGMYQIRIRVIYDYNTITHFADPVQLLVNSEKSESKSSSKIVPAHILDEFSCFNSRIMLIRYQEEIINLYEGCEFKFEVPTSQDFNLKILADLYFTNMETSPKTKNTFRKLEESPVMSCIISKEFRINNPQASVSSYLPLTFDPTFFCVADALVHVYPREYIFSMPFNFFENGKIIGGIQANKTYSLAASPLYLSYTHIRSICQDLISLNSPTDIRCPPEISLPLQNPSSASFHDSLETHDSVSISNSILEELESLSDYLSSALSILQNLTSLNNFKSIHYFKQKFNQEAWHHFQEFIKLKEFTSPVAVNFERTTKDEEIRREEYYKNLESLSIQAEDLYHTLNKHPIFLFSSEVDHFKSVTECAFAKSSDIHIVFLVHGYRGSSIDMHMIKGYLNIIYPMTYVYSCKSNENFTDCNIENLGQNLAQEVTHYVAESRVPKYRLKISLVGHSLGGLIIRAALKYMYDLKNCFYTYISLSSPHIGIYYSENMLHQLGKWALKKLQDSTSFIQMMLKDAKRKQDTFIYKLSQSEGLNWFQHVLFFTCSEDPYVPVDSAGSYIPPKSIGDKHEAVFAEIVKNLLDKVGSERFIRVDVSFRYTEIVNICVLCGNRHIDFLDDPCFIKMMFFSMPKLFG